VNAFFVFSIVYALCILDGLFYMAMAMASDDQVQQNTGAQTASVCHNASIYSCCVRDPGPVTHLYGLRG